MQKRCLLRFGLLICVAAIGAGLCSASAQESASPPAALPERPPLPDRIRVGGNIQATSLVHKVAPKYPAKAKEEHVQGTVVLHVVIGKDGTIQQLSYVSGPQLLMKSAMDAVKKWRYKPTLLNGQPVEVDTTISVVYTMVS